MKTKIIKTKPHDFYKIREDIRKRRNKKKVLTDPVMFCIRKTMNNNK